MQYEWKTLRGFDSFANCKANFCFVKRALEKCTMGKGLRNEKIDTISNYMRYFHLMTKGK